MPGICRLHHTSILPRCSRMTSFERFLGMAYGSLWLDEADEMWVIGTELSEGMKQELEYARKKNIPVTMKKV